ncbi:MAG: hypothetical protein ACMUEL_06985 [Flavobacteriales bacterium Tduv]
MIVATNITVRLFAPKGAHYLRSEGSKGRWEKANKSKKSKGKKRGSIRSRSSRQMA